MVLEYANKNNIKVIIIDHHKVDNILPECFAHINPTRKDDNSNLNHLAAVGLTFLFIVGLRRALRDIKEFNNISEPNLKKYLDIVALGTICDVVQLKSLNRAFVKEGLKIINNTDKIGIKSLCSVAGIKNIDVYELGYILGPRINAAGRTGSPELGFRLLTSDNNDETNAIADKLNELNKERQNIERKVLDQSLEKVENYKNYGLPETVNEKHFREYMSEKIHNWNDIPDYFKSDNFTKKDWSEEKSKLNERVDNLKNADFAETHIERKYRLETEKNYDLYKIAESNEEREKRLEIENNIVNKGLAYSDDELETFYEYTEKLKIHFEN